MKRFSIQKTRSPIRNRIPGFILFFCALALCFYGCAELQNILLQETARTLKRCEFKLVGVRNFQVNDVALSGMSSISQIPLSSYVQLGKTFAQKRLPTKFTLDIGAKNPNDGSGTLEKASALLTQFPWTLYIDEQKTITGGLAEKIQVPGNNQQIIIPLGVDLDLYQFFQGNSLKSLLNLALSLGGVNKDPSRLSLKAKPTFETQYGPITYPEEIEIINREYRGSPTAE